MLYCLHWENISKIPYKKIQHITKALRNWMLNGTSKPNKIKYAIGEHLLNNSDCSKTTMTINFQ